MHPRGLMSPFVEPVLGLRAASVPQFRRSRGHCFQQQTSHPHKIEGRRSERIDPLYALDATGGTSGSPVFDHNGRVVAVNHAGIEVRVLDVDGREVRIAMGSLDKGIHVAAVWDFLDHLESDRIAAHEGTLSRETLTQDPYPHPTYQPFHENWNGRMIRP